MGRHSGPLKEHYEQSMSTIHDNFNLLCAIDLRTTGPFPGQCDIYEVCILPLGSYLEPYEPITPYYTQIQPFRERPHKFAPGVKAGYNRAVTGGLEYGMSIDMLDEWFDNLPLNLGKKILPLAYNWPLTYAFLINWLGLQHVHQYFDYRFRDLLSTAHYLNDFADFHVQTYPFKKIDYSYLCSECNIEHQHNSYDSLENCVNIAEMYRQMIKEANILIPKYKGPIEDDIELLGIEVPTIK